MPITNGHPSHPSPVPSGEYTFPRQRLKPVLEDASKQPIVLVACGSFSPITYLHLRMFEMAKDFIKHSGENFELVGAYFSPVSDHYKKRGRKFNLGQMHVRQGFILGNAEVQRKSRKLCTEMRWSD